MEVFCCSTSRRVYSTVLVGQIAGSTHCQGAKAVYVKQLKVATGTHKQKQNAFEGQRSRKVFFSSMQLENTFV